MNNNAVAKLEGLECVCVCIHRSIYWVFVYVNINVKQRENWNYLFNCRLKWCWGRSGYSLFLKWKLLELLCLRRSIKSLVKRSLIQEASYSRSKIPCLSSVTLLWDNILMIASLHLFFKISCGDSKWKPPVGLTNDFKGRSEVMCSLLMVPFFPPPHLTKSTLRLCPIRSPPKVTWGLKKKTRLVKVKRKRWCWSGMCARVCACLFTWFVVRKRMCEQARLFASRLSLNWVYSGLLHHRRQYVPKN